MPLESCTTYLALAGAYEGALDKPSLARRMPSPRQALQSSGGAVMDLSKSSSLEGEGLDIALDLPAIRAELAAVQARCAARGLLQVGRSGVSEF